MKWNVFKRGGKARTNRLAAGGRRVTGVVTDLPDGVKTLLEVSAGVLITLALCWGGWTLFKTYYFHSRSLFVLGDVRSDVTITTGKTLTPELICEVLSLKDGVNLFSLPIAEKRAELLEQTPNIREIAITRRLPDKIFISIVEREPIARVGSNGRVVDEEGVVFIRYAGTGGLPMIKGSEELAQINPGDRLHGNEMAAVRLVNNAQRPGCRLRLLALDTSKEDYLLLTFADYRQAKFAWEGMSDEATDTEQRMQRQFDKLAQVMESAIGQPRVMWDATLPDRISAMAVGVQ